MQVSESVMATPYYVLMDQNTPFSVRVADSSLDIEYTAIFGFSDKVQLRQLLWRVLHIINAISARQRLFAP